MISLMCHLLYTVAIHTIEFVMCRSYKIAIYTVLLSDVVRYY